ncbi:chromate resistance protein ChrB domain-containing protein [Sandaracinus amylolyticus]|uniref:Chromate resistance protein ChrB n=1 Tax=Sandaracinus amylolyticus TaxID=927083 RepID=A0A0F6W6P1_9BACT|nr:chromate resistance protein ChrB domain-containing protein [Sandaracinus amylolyticus]AKF08640.1 Chromate resistance protein ChrB [Sandaracinus amylolyticus]
MADEPRWILLVHQIPAKPDYLRVKIGRRLQRIGAVALKRTVYALPRSEQAREDFDWIRREIEAGGGEAMVIDASLAAGLSDAQVEDLFRTAREPDYGAIAAEARAIARALPRRALSDEKRHALASDVARLEHQLEELARIDFFDAPSREAVRGLVAALRARADAPVRDDAVAPAATPPRGRTWVTRAGVHVDRIASAWLVRRFIDPEATFKLVPPKGYVPLPGELRFDMDAAEYTHEGDLCTFEVLCRRFALDAPGLRAIAEIVHDIDLKDAKHARPETAGVAAAIAGIALLHREDEQRIAIGGALFEALLAAFARRARERT